MLRFFNCKKNNILTINDANLKEIMQKQSTLRLNCSKIKNKGKRKTLQKIECDKELLKYQINQISKTCLNNHIFQISERRYIR